VAAAQPELDRFLDAELARYRLTADRLVLVGFSQGTMMALHVGLRRAVAPAGIVAYSGLLAGPDHLAETKARPPVLLVHGEADEMIPVEALQTFLARSDAPVDLREFFGKEVFKSIIPRSVRLAEAPSFGKPILAYDPRSRGAEAYIQLAKEIMAHERAHEQRARSESAKSAG